jgi:hypothetical protein
MEADFDVQIREGGVDVTFRPTESNYSYGLLVDPDDIARLGPLSRSPNTRDAKTGDTHKRQSGQPVKAESPLTGPCIYCRL